MGAADQWRQMWSRHRNAILAGGGALAVGAAVIIRKRNSTAGPDVGYPAAMTGGAVPTLDTTATDAYSEFGDQVAAFEDWQTQQFDALNKKVGGLDHSVDTLGRRIGKLGNKIGKGGGAGKGNKPPKSPRPKKPHQTPKAHHKPPPKKLPPSIKGPVLRGGVPLNPLRPKPKPKKKTPPPPPPRTGLARKLPGAPPRLH